MKQYLQVMRTIALLTVLALTAPSAAALICDVACTAQHEAATLGSSCHDSDTSEPGERTVSASHLCHDIGVLPASIVRDGGSHTAVAPAVVRETSDLAAVAAGRALVARQARLTNHAPPPPALPLRI